MNVRTFSNEPAWLDDMIAHWQQTSGQAIHRRGLFKAALCGDDFFLPLYHRIARSDTALSAARFFIVNELCVPQTHRNSRYRAIFEAFYPHRIHLERWKTEISKPEAVATDYGRRLKMELSDPPKLDLAILALSKDSPPPFAFPAETPETLPSLTASENVGQPPVPRLSMTLHLLKQAREIWFLARAPLTATQASNTLADPSSLFGALVKERAALANPQKIGEANTDKIFFCST